MSSIRELRRKLLNNTTIAAAAGLLIASIILLWISKELSSWSDIWFGGVVPAFASVLATSGVFAIVYEVFVRNQQTEYVMESLGLKESLIKAGLTDITTHYLDYDYGARILHSRDIRLFVLYAQSWMNRYAVELTEYLKRDNRSLTLYLPSLDNPFLPPLIDHFGLTHDDMRAKICSTIAVCVTPAVKQQIGDGSNVRVFLHRSRPAYSMYMFDDRLLIGAYYAGNSRRRAAMFEFSKTDQSMFNEFADDIAQVERESELIYDARGQVSRLKDILGENAPRALLKHLGLDGQLGGTGPAPVSETDPKTA